MIIVAITAGIVFGWLIGNRILDKWVNEGNDEVND
jgi:hypothetical protein